MHIFYVEQEEQEKLQQLRYWQKQLIAQIQIMESLAMNVKCV